MAIKVPVSVGEQLTFGKTISDYDVYGFAGITGDFARNHVNEEYMSKHSPYGRRIAHGLLSLCMSSTCSTSVGHFLRTVHTCYPFLFSAPAFALV